MEDIRHNWQIEAQVQQRKKEALRLAKILKYKKTINLLLRFKIKDDGRHFRQDFECYGGYEGMEILHSFLKTDNKYCLGVRSSAFKKAIKKYITIPEMMFWDVEF